MNHRWRRLGRGLQLVRPVGQGVGDRLAEHRVAVSLGVLARRVGHHRVEVGVARGERVVHHLREGGDLGAGEQVGGHLAVLARRLGVDELLVGAQLAQGRGDRGDLLRRVEAVGGGAADLGEEDVAHQDGDQVRLAPAEVDQLGPAAELGVVDGEGDALVGREEVVHERGVAVEVVGDRTDVGEPSLAGEGVDLGPQVLELAQPVEGALVGGLDRTSQARHLGPQVGHRGVGVGPRLGVVLHRQGEGVARRRAGRRRPRCARSRGC